MYEELVELLRMRAALIDSDLDNQAAEAIKILEALAQNGQSAIDTNKRLADKIRMLKAKLDQAEEDERRGNYQAGTRTQPPKA